MSLAPLVLCGLFCSLVVLCNVVSSKLVQLGPLVVPLGVFFYPLTFAVTDVVSEAFGKRCARGVVWAGLWANLALLLVSAAVVAIPSVPFADDSAMVKVFSSAPRLVLASVLAYLVSQHHDVWAFHLWKALTRGRLLAVRSFLSTSVSQLLDALVFMTVAFYGSFPVRDLAWMVFSQYLLKLLFALLSVPLVYLGVRWASGSWEVREILD